jgi:hypothetical protein
MRGESLARKLRHGRVNEPEKAGKRGTLHVIERARLPVDIPIVSLPLELGEMQHERVEYLSTSILRAAVLVTNDHKCGKKKPKRTRTEEADRREVAPNSLTWKGVPGARRV